MVRVHLKPSWLADFLASRGARVTAGEEEWPASAPRRLIHRSARDIRTHSAPLPRRFTATLAKLRQTREFKGFDLPWRGAPHYTGIFPAVSKETWRTLKRRQVEALEWIDDRLEELCAHLPRPVMAIVVADHGDCLGEQSHFGHGFYHPKVPMYMFRLI